MWSSSPLRNSSRQASCFASRQSDVVAGSSARRLSDWDKSGRRGGAGRGAGRGGDGRSSRRGDQVEGAMTRFRKMRQAEKEKQNFAKSVLEPAARGELKNHQSGIPKLAARKGKSHKVHDEFAEVHKTTLDLVDEATFPEEDQDSGMVMDVEAVERGRRARDGGVRVTYQTQSAEAFYDSEDEFDIMQEEDMIHNLEDHPDITPNEDGTHTLYYDPGEVVGSSDGKGQRRGDENAEARDPVSAYFVRRPWSNPDMETERIPAERYNRVLPLADHGPELEDFLEAHLEHPAKYAEVTRYNHHSEYEREPKPDFPQNRLLPSEEFVTSHKRFLYVTGLPHFTMDDDEVGDFENPVHRYEVVKMVSGIFGIEAEHVSPCNMTSAFIGYVDKQKFYDAQRSGPSRRSFVKPILITRYSGTEHDEFVNSSDAVVELSHLPAGMSAGKLSHALFPAGSELGSIYGPISKDQVLITSPVTALVRLESAKHAESAISSAMLESHLKELGSSRVRYFKARREIVHAKFGGPNMCREMKRRGYRLIVDGDAPSPEFYRSHAGVLHLRGLKPSVTKKDLAEIFQPFSMDRRDVTGSVEFVKCEEGLPTDRAFVGFDALDEAEKVLTSCSGLLQIGKTKVVVRAVKDKHQFRLERHGGKEPKESRPMRSQEDILESLNNWEQFVDPKEIQELEELGIRKEVLDSAFRTMRFQNKTFGPSDQALTRERLVPDRSSGDDYRETVREYIDTLKECMATPENPGLVYKSLFFPNEELDLSFFDVEKERQKKLRAKYEGTSS